MTPTSNMVRDLLDLSHVPRFTTHPVARTQSVAEHSYRVAVLAMDLTLRYHQQADLVPEERFLKVTGGLTTDRLYEIVRWALVHDGPEVKTGDFPAPVKRFLTREAITDLEDESCPWYRAERPPADSFTAAVVHLADLIESITWISRYGQALRDRWDDERIELKLRRRLQTEVSQWEKQFVGLEEAVNQLVQEVTP